jgi:hypothetical protein
MSYDRKVSSALKVGKHFKNMGAVVSIVVDPFGNFSR